MKAKDELYKNLNQPHIDSTEAAVAADIVIENILEDTDVMLQSLREKLNDEDFAKAVDWIDRLKKESIQ